MNATIFYFNQLIDALYYMMKKKLVCHRDLKPENFLIDANYDLQLADFGFCSETLADQMDASHLYK